jgi:hypothetical protein
MTPGVYLALTLAVLFGIGTFLFALATSPRHNERRRARRAHPTWPHNTPPNRRN